MGGSGEDVGVNVGSGTFIPGFEDQIIGHGGGRDQAGQGNVPGELYEPAARRQGRGVRCDREGDRCARHGHGRRGIRQVARPSKSLAKLRETLKGAAGGRRIPPRAGQKLKRKLLDQLDQLHKFAGPPDLDRRGVQERLVGGSENDLKTQGRSFADEGTTEEEGARGIPRPSPSGGCGSALVLAEIGERNAIQVSDDELSRELVERTAPVSPAREQEIWGLLPQEPRPRSPGVRAPLFRGEGRRFQSWSSPR